MLAGQVKFCVQVMASSSCAAFDIGQLCTADGQCIPDNHQCSLDRQQEQWLVAQLLHWEPSYIRLKKLGYFTCCRYLGLLVEVSAVEQEVNKVGGWGPRQYSNEGTLVFQQTVSLHSHHHRSSRLVIASITPCMVVSTPGLANWPRWPTLW